jgi:anti-sigma factor RsiW
MRCRKAQQLISADFDGQLDEARRAILHAHQADCRECEQFARQVRGISEALCAAEAPEPQADFTERFMARLPLGQRERFSVRDWLSALRPAPIAAGGLALAAGVILALIMNGQQPAAAPKAGDPLQQACAQALDPLPGGSAAAQYVALVEQEGR